MSYEKIIEYPIVERINWTNDNLVIDKSCDLFFILNQFIKEHLVLKETSNIGISLSGGVDSMVLTSVLMHLAKSIKFKIVAAHLNYNNREETVDEEEFIREWCIKNNIGLKVVNITEFKRGITNREIYEKETKEIRFNMYKDLIKTYNLNGIFLAHHKGDEQENSFTNIMNGRNLLNISAMEDKSIIDNVRIFRPLINNIKSDIYKFAHLNNIPYFKDSTPDWSNRGKLRRKVFPLLKEIYGQKYLDNLYNISQESKEWNDFILKNLIEPFFEINVKINGNNVKIDSYINYKDYPLIFWNIILNKITRQQKIENISKKALRVFIFKLQNDFIGSCPLNKSIDCNFMRENKQKCIKLNVKVNNY